MFLVFVALRSVGIIWYEYDVIGMCCRGSCPGSDALALTIKENTAEKERKREPALGM